mgnify:CR=1 FL=1
MRIVPASRELQCALPGHKPDFFVAAPIELVRKATDELTLGLHWLVAFMMVHSAVDQGGSCKVHFDPGKVHRNHDPPRSPNGQQESLCKECLRAKTCPVCKQCSGAFDAKAAGAQRHPGSGGCVCVHDCETDEYKKKAGRDFSINAESNEASNLEACVEKLHAYQKYAPAYDWRCTLAPLPLPL